VKNLEAIDRSHSTWYMLAGLPQNRDHSVSDDPIVRFRSSIATGKNCGRDKRSKFSLGHVVVNVVDTDARFLRRLAIEAIGYLLNGRCVKPMALKGNSRGQMVKAVAYIRTSQHRIDRSG
jgi:hypothetical protein